MKYILLKWLNLNQETTCELDIVRNDTNYPMIFDSYVAAKDYGFKMSSIPCYHGYRFKTVELRNNCKPLRRS